jgi:hypothetical protein
VNDARGAVFQLIRSTDNSPIAMNDDYTYRGNVVADMQIMVAKAILDGKIQSTPQLQTAVNSIDETIIQWASRSDGRYEPQYRCNGDSMHHVGKGMTIIRVEDALGFKIEDNVLRRIENLSPPVFTNCYDYHKGTNIENADDESSLQQGTNIRGISVGAVTGYENGRNSKIMGNKIVRFSSDNANVIVGIDIQGISDSISVTDNKVNLKEDVGHDHSDEFIALRLRKFSDGPDNKIDVEHNSFSQEIITMNVKSKVVSGCPHQKMSNEWKVGGSPGGCPFGFRNKNKRDAISDRDT